jgi:hypothetical protein
MRRNRVQTRKEREYGAHVGINSLELCFLSDNQQRRPVDGPRFGADEYIYAFSEDFGFGFLEELNPLDIVFPTS